MPTRSGSARWPSPGPFELLIRFTMTVAIAFDTMVLLGYFKLRRDRPELAHPFTLAGWLTARLLPAGTA